jgi:hypothetical protein
MESLLVFVLAALCWTKSLLCNVAAFTGMLFYSESTDECQILHMWTPLFAFTKPLVLLFSNVFG